MDFGRLLFEDRFEDLCKQILIREFPDMHGVDGRGGDEGTDSFRGMIDQQSHIFQFKYFPNRLDSSRRKQICKSLEKSYAKKPKKWFLLVPTKLTQYDWKWWKQLQSEFSQMELKIWDMVKLEELVLKYQNKLEIEFLELFQNTQLARRIADEVYDKFNKRIVELNLLNYNFRLITAFTEFPGGNRDCWKLGHFREEDIKNDYDARRPITNTILNSIEENVGTILYGKSHYGKSVILKRVMFEEIQNGSAVIFIDSVDGNAYSITKLIKNISTYKFPKLILIADNVHRAGNEKIFQVFNNISAAMLGRIRFLFASRDNEFNKTRELLDPDESREVRTAINKMNQVNLNFSVIDAKILLEKALFVTKEITLAEKKVKEIAKAFYEASSGDPLMFTCLLTQYLNNGNEDIPTKSYVDCLEIDFNEKQSSLDKNESLWKPALCCTIMGAFGISLSSNLLQNCQIYLHDLISLTGLSFLFLNGSYKVRHEKWALEFLIYLYSRYCGNDPISFGAKYRIHEIIKCIISNLKVDDIINIFDACSILFHEPRAKSLVEIVIQNVEKPRHLNDQEIASVYCFGYGKFYSSSKDFDAALKSFDYALEINPNYASAWNNKGVIYQEIGDRIEAIKCYDKALEIDNSFVNSLYNKGNAFLDLGNYDDAIRFYDKALEIEPSYSMTWANRGNALHSQRNVDEALKCYDKALELDKKNNVAWINKGNTLYELKRYEDAIKCYDKALEIDPRDLLAWNYKGRVYHDIKRYEDAIKCYDKALEINEKSTNTWIDRGITFDTLEKFDDALESFSKAIEIDPHDPMAWTNKGSLLLKLRDDNEGLKCINNAISLYPHYYLPWYQKGYFEYKSGKYNEAIVNFTKALEHNSIQPMAWLLKGISNSKLGNNEDAIKCYDKALELDNTSFDAWTNKGASYYSLSNYDKAIDSFDKAISLKPQSSDVLYYRSCSKVQKGNLGDGLNDLQTAIALDRLYKEAAITEHYFDKIRNDDRFRSIIT